MTTRAVAIAVCVAAATAPAAASAWEYFEHRYLGDAACTGKDEGKAKTVGEEAGVACVQVEVAGEPGWSVTFGDLVAMAGDHYETPGDLKDALKEYRDRLAARKACQGQERCPSLDDTDIGRILRAREFQLAGVRAWLAASPGRIAAARSHDVAWLTLDGLRARPAATDAAQERLQKEEAARAEQAVPEARLTPVEQKRLERLREDARRTREYLESQRDRKPRLLDAVPEPAEWTARIDTVALAPLRGDCYLPGADEEALFAQLDRYVALAARNGSHFGAKTVAESERLAQEAQRLRAEARGWCEEDCAANLAFALHHWTDRFSAGHMRTPRTRLANMEAKRRHDFDDVNGLVVYQADDPKPRLWRAFGDTCLLGVTAGPARERTVEGTRRLLRLVAGTAPGSGAYPEVAPQNLAVPRSPRYVEVLVEPGFGGGWADGTSHRPAFAARWDLIVHLRGWWVPPPLSQALLTGPRIDALVPVAVEPLELGLQLVDLVRACDPDAAAPQSDACWRRATTSWAGWRDLSFQPAVGWALARTTGSGALRSAFYAGLFGRYELYDGLFVGAAAETLSGRPWGLVWSVNAALRVR